ncbi:MAG: HAMP domain-containing histidine kinase [Bryobacterales bacterium]|nr:HAMP domain-containing histidine kinase [Bryobacterales bacterium]
MSGDSELTVEGLAHDLNNVFETLSEAAEVLSSDPKWTKLASTIRRSVRRGERIVTSLNETISDSGDLTEILDNAVQHAEDVLTFTRGTAILYSRRVDPGVTLPGSQAAWERVFVNLFLNAAQANPQGAEVEIGASCSGGVVTLTVTDNGPGIPASILPAIFEPNVTTKKSRGRRGLGLHIVQSIVADHGGTVTARNHQPRGAVFTVTLPQSGVA